MGTRVDINTKPMFRRLEGMIVGPGLDTYRKAINPTKPNLGFGTGPLNGEGLDNPGSFP